MIKVYLLAIIFEGKLQRQRAFKYESDRGHCLVQYANDLRGEYDLPMRNAIQAAEYINGLGGFTIYETEDEI